MFICRILMVILLTLRIFFITDVEAFQYPKHVNPPERRSSPSRDTVKAYNRAETSANVFKSIMIGQPENSFPKELLDTATAIAVFPAKLKYGALTGHKGSGIVSTRDFKTGLWLPPIFINISGDNVTQYFDGNSDLVVFAINPDAMKAFFINEFKVEKAVTSQEFLTPSIADAGQRFHFVAYRHTNETLTLVNIENSTIKHDGMLNFAVYGERQLKPYLPTSKPISNRVLTFPLMLNSYTQKAN